MLRLLHAACGPLLCVSSNLSKVVRSRTLGLCATTPRCYCVVTMQVFCLRILKCLCCLAVSHFTLVTYNEAALHLLLYPFKLDPQYPHTSFQT